MAQLKREKLFLGKPLGGWIIGLTPTLFAVWLILWTDFDLGTSKYGRPSLVFLAGAIVSIFVFGMMLTIESLSERARHSVIQEIVNRLEARIGLIADKSIIDSVSDGKSSPIAKKLAEQFLADQRGMLGDLFKEKRWKIQTTALYDVLLQAMEIADREILIVDQDIRRWIELIDASNPTSTVFNYSRKIVSSLFARLREQSIHDFRRIFVLGESSLQVAVELERVGLTLESTAEDVRKLFESKDKKQVWSHVGQIIRPILVLRFLEERVRKHHSKAPGTFGTRVLLISRIADATKDQARSILDIVILNGEIGFVEDLKYTDQHHDKTSFDTTSWLDLDRAKLSEQIKTFNTLWQATHNKVAAFNDMITELSNCVPQETVDAFVAD